MGCGASKMLPEASKKGYASFMKSVVVSFSNNNSKEYDLAKQKKNNKWNNYHDDNAQHQHLLKKQSQVPREIEKQDKVAKYRARFDPRVTARYDIKALIGRGSFSRVVRAEHRTTRQPFAIKVMEVDAPEGRGVCSSELAVLRRVSHANVIQLVEVLESTQRVYMVLELATGGELLDRVIAKGYFTEQDASGALQMVLAGVGYLHNLGIIHRDLKPENLLYYHPGADSRLLVTDFGLAGFKSRIGGSGNIRVVGEVGGHMRDNNGADVAGSVDCSLRTTCGTPEYMAPEVILRRPYSCAVDMWALGVIAYLLLSGSLPFDDDSHPRLYRAILRGSYSFHRDPWPSMSNLAKELIERLLAVDPGGRLSAEQALCHRWVVTMAAGSSMKNLHRSISQNLRRRASQASSQCPIMAASSGGGGGGGGVGGQAGW
ncbi:serine/threonine-protein kinase H1-like [Aplochiton taeniatus]